MESRGNAVFAALLLLAVAAGGILIAEDRMQSRRPGRAEEFQRLVGGVGFGSAVDLTGCAFSFDPRLDSTCGEDCGAIPGGSCFCPRHALSVFYYPPVQSGLQGTQRQGETILWPDLESNPQSP